MIRYTHIILFILFISSCKNKEEEYDASGTFEAVETIVSAEATGIIKELSVEEGQTLKKGEAVGYIDSLQLHLKRKQLLAQIKALLSRTPNSAIQVAAMEEQLKQAEKEQLRIRNLLKADAATPKQMDDVTAQIAVLNKQIEATRSTLGISSTGIAEESVPLQVQVEQLNDQLTKCRIVNPVEGTVLTKYAEKNEVTSAGKPIYKIANLSTVTLRAYVTGEQLSRIKTNQTVKVLVDEGKEKYKEYDGTIQWISDKAEFTPKTIQTKEERANLVYAIKIKVKNDGYLKIGMYADIKI